jgi:hypothetical protein
MLLTGALLSALAEPLYLVRIPREDAAQLALLQRLQVAVVQELETCFIARADREDIRVLRKTGVPFAVLDSDAAGKDYFLVPASAGPRLTWLRTRGRLISVESGTLLCWTKGENLSAAIPPGVSRKPLPFASVLAGIKAVSPLRLPPGYRTAGDQLIQFIVSQVSEVNLRSLVTDLELFKTRYASTPECAAAGDFIFYYFEALGLNTSFDPFTFDTSLSSRNIIAEKRGGTDPGEILIICAHYDSTSGSPLTLAPGADDNGSGTAAVMEAARILLPHSFDFTVRFIAFSAEEWGLYGSRHYATQARSRGERIIGVINLDMIAYADQVPEDLDVIVNPYSEWLAERVRLSAEAYTGLPVREIVNASFVYSDHASFWETGYPALLGIEDEPLQNPYYHQTTDTVETLNFDFFSDSTKTALSTLTELAQPVRPGYPRTPAGLEAEALTYISLFNSLTDVHLSWAAVPGASGYNVYRSITPHLDYARINASGVLTTSFVDRLLGSDLPYYYYVVTAVGRDGLESNFSREAEVAPPAALAPGTKIRFYFPLLNRRSAR